MNRNLLKGKKIQIAESYMKENLILGFQEEALSKTSRASG